VDIVADETMLSPALGTRRERPVEVVLLACRSHLENLHTLVPQGRGPLRATPGGAPFVTDQGNVILDCAIGPIERPRELAAQLQARAGVVAHGLFLGIATDVIIAGRSGVEHRRHQ
jgi:ribose 5-phosphate isomerase A